MVRHRLRRLNGARDRFAARCILACRCPQTERIKARVAETAGARRRAGRCDAARLARRGFRHPGQSTCEGTLRGGCRRPDRIDHALCRVNRRGDEWGGRAGVAKHYGQLSTTATEPKKMATAKPAATARAS